MESTNKWGENAADGGTLCPIQGQNISSAMQEDLATPLTSPVSALGTIPPIQSPDGSEGEIEEDVKGDFLNSTDSSVLH